MSGMLPKSQVPWMSANKLSDQEHTALIHAKQGIREGAHKLKGKQKEEYEQLKFHLFENEKQIKETDEKQIDEAAGMQIKKIEQKTTRDKPSPLPDLQSGYEYIACYLPRIWNPDKKRGVRRLVFECHKTRNQFEAIYYTDDHYEKFSFWRIE
jgi:hypothetical protein